MRKYHRSIRKRIGRWYERKRVVPCIEKIVEKKEKYKALMIASFDPEGVLTVRQTIYEVMKKSQLQIDLLNIREGIPKISEKYLDKYHAIIIHNTVSYSIEGVDAVNDFILKNFGGIKVLMKQDEHFCTNLMTDFVKRSGIHLLLTLWDEDTAALVYKKRENPRLELMQYLTGYVTDEYRNIDFSCAGRIIDVGYRGSIQPVLFGSLAYEKHYIGDKFAKFAEQRSLTYDISSKWEDRFMGEDWLSFLKKCKGVLGVESGSNIVDYDGKIRKQYIRYLRHHKNASEEELLKLLSPYEGKIRYAVISPRHLEAAACRTAQILFEGEYQNIFLPHRHYIPLKKDFSNANEVIDQLLDDKVRKDITDCAFEEIIMNDKYSFTYFVQQLDERIIGLIEKERGRIGKS